MTVLNFMVTIDADRLDLATDASAGFIGGRYKWSTSTYSGYTTGIIDQEHIDSFGAQCNIALGGEVSTPSSTVSVSVDNSAVYDHITNNAVQLVGKKLTVLVSINGAAPTYLDVSSVSGLTYESLSRIRIETSEMYSLGSVPLVKTVINNSVLLGLDGALSGDTVTTEYGTTVNVQMTPFTPTGSPAVGSSNLDYHDILLPVIGWIRNGTGDLESWMPPSMDVYGYSTSQGGASKTKTEFFVQKVYNDPAHEYLPTRVLLNENITEAFQHGRSVWVGGVMRLTHGGGEGSVYTIVSVSDTTYDGVFGSWLTLDRRTTDIVGAGVYSDTEVSDANPYWGAMKPIADIMDIGANWNSTYRNTRVVTTYKDALDSNDVTTVVLGYPQNVYLVPRSITSSEITHILGYTSGTPSHALEIPVTSAEVILQDTQYSLVRIVPQTGKVTETDTSLVLTVTKEYPCYIDTHTATVGLGVYSPTCRWQRGGGLYSNGVLSTIPDKQMLSSTVWSEPFVPATINDLQNIHQISLFTRIDVPPSVSDPYSPSSDFVTAVYPVIGFAINCDMPWERLKLTLRVHVVSETGVACGYQEISREFNQTELSGIGSLQLDMRGATSDLLKDFEEQVKSGLDVSKYCRTANSLSAKYLYTMLVIDSTSYLAGHALTTYIKSQGVGLGISIDKSTLKATIVQASVPYPIATPVALMRSVLDSTSTALLDTSAFSTVETTVINAMTSLGGNMAGYSATSGQTISDILSEIAHGSGLGLITSRAGIVRPRWWMDDYRDGITPSHTFDQTGVVAGSLGISRQSSGFMSTDYSFSFPGDPPKTLSVNTSIGGDTFPLQSGWVIQANTPDILGTLSAPLEFTGATILTFTPTVPFNIRTSPFVQGMSYRISVWLGLASYEVICKLNQIFYDGAWKLSVTKQVCTDGTTPPSFIGKNFFDNVGVMRQQSDWRYLTSSNIKADYYLLGKNAWEIAKRARDFAGVSIPLPSEYGILTQPLWTTNQAMTNYALYTIIHGSYPKTIITFDAPIDSTVVGVYLLDYVSVAVGPYKLRPTYGWVVGCDTNPSSGTITFKVLTAVSDEDILYLDENHTLGLSAQIILTEDITSSIVDEGGLT